MSNTKKQSEIFKPHYLQYWDIVKGSVDNEGWVYSKEVGFMLDAYFEDNTNQEIEFQKSYEGEWKGVRWRPKSISKLFNNGNQ